MQRRLDRSTMRSRRLCGFATDFVLGGGSNLVNVVLKWLGT